MNYTNYQKANSYVRKCGYSRDLVHDAYIKWYDKTGKNLFLEPERTVIAVVRNVVGNEHQRNNFVRNNVKHRRHFVDIEEVYSMQVPPNQEVALLLAQVREKSKSLKGTYRTVYDWVSRGFNPCEIQEIEGLTHQNIRWHRKRLKLYLN